MSRLDKDSLLYSLGMINLSKHEFFFVGKVIGKPFSTMGKAYILFNLYILIFIGFWMWENRMELPIS